MATKPPWRDVTRFLSPIFIAGLAARLFIAARNYSAETHLSASLSWTMLVLMSFIGWGSAAAYLAARDEEADLGLRAAWGMGIAIAFGGVLVLFHVASPQTLGGFVALGIALYVAYACVRSATDVERLERFAREVRRNPWLYCGVVVLAGLVVLQAISAVYDVAEWGVSDDAPAYQVFPKQIIESGGFDQPFSFRRLSAYGGQSLLQAFLLVELPVQRLHLLDRGLATAVVMLLVLGAPRVRFRVPYELVLLPLLVVVTVENVRQNLASEMSGVVFVLGLYRTMRWAPCERAVHGVGVAALLALLGAGALTLRQNYASVIVPMLVIGYAASFFRSGAPLHERVRELRAPLITMGLAFIILLPWAIAAQRSCGTFLYPFVAGNYDAGIGFESGHDKLVRLQLYWYNVSHSLPIASVHAFVLAAFIVRDRSPRRAMVALLIGSLLGFVALLQYAWQANPDDYKRYYFAFEIALVCGVTLTTFEDGADKPDESPNDVVRWPAVLVVFASLWQLFTGLPNLQKTLGASGVMRLQTERATPTTDGEHGEDAIYAHLQASIPAQAKILVMLDEPYRLDFARNTIDLIDLPGVVSPKPGMPTTDPDALATYLAAHDIRYVAFVRKAVSKHLYNAAVWEGHLRGKPDIPQHGKMARVTLDVMNEIDELAARRKHVFDQQGMVVLDLASR